MRGSSDSGTDVVHVLYIAGIGRSGSTLLCRALGSIDGFVGTGELMRILSRGVLNGDLCSCGAPVRSCELWEAVQRELDQRCPGADLERMEHIRSRITESWNLVPYLFLPDRHSGLADELDAYRRFVLAVYRSIRAVTGARVIVDASKSVLFAKLLTETPGVRLTPSAA